MCLSPLSPAQKYIRLYDGFMGRTSMDALKELGIQDVAVVRMLYSILDKGMTMIMQSIDSKFEAKEWFKV